jgi:hypothetical protein
MNDTYMELHRKGVREAAHSGPPLSRTEIYLESIGRSLAAIADALCFDCRLSGHAWKDTPGATPAKCTKCGEWQP